MGVVVFSIAVREFPTFRSDPNPNTYFHWKDVGGIGPKKKEKHTAPQEKDNDALQLDYPSTRSERDLMFVKFSLLDFVVEVL